MLKGVFNRKDNGKQLTTTRVVEGDELIQVGTIFKGIKNLHLITNRDIG